MIKFKGTHDPVFSEYIGSPRNDVTERHKISPLDAPLSGLKSKPRFTSSSLITFFLERIVSDVASLSERNKLCKVSL